MRREYEQTTMSSISNRIRDGFTYELMALTILPSITTILWQTAVQTKIDVPFLGSLLTMIVINYAALSLKNWGGYSNDYLLGRILADAVSIGLTIGISNVAYPFKGIPSPTTWQSTFYTSAGLLCVIATTRGFTFLFLIIQDKFLDYQNDS